MNSCNSLLDEFSCRFCLGDAKNGSLISNTTYFRVDKRIVETAEIFKLLNLPITSSPLVPNRICGECQNTIVGFYSLKKNYQDNEAILLGKAEEEPVQSVENEVPADLPAESNVLSIVKEFMKENADKSFNISKFPNKILIETEEVPEDIETTEEGKQKLKVENISSNYIEYIEKSVELEEPAGNFVTDDESNDQPMEEEITQEEYLEDIIDPEVDNENSYETIPPDIQEYSEIKEEPSDANPFPCFHCEKTFVSRSGRDTHQQLKHKVPDNFDPSNFKEHEEEIDHDGKKCIVWKCPECSHYSKKKDHHRTHLIRHATREKEATIKQEIESGYLIQSETGESQDGKLVCEVEEDKSQENLHFEVVQASSTDKPPDECHLQRNFEETFFFCSECQSKFPSEELGGHHIAKFGSTGLCLSCVCVECGVVFPTLKLLKRHQDYHAIAGVIHSINFFECLTCSVVFASQNDLDNHLQLHVHLPKEDSEQFQFQPEFNTKLDGCELLVKNLNEEWSGSGRLRCGHCSKIGSRDEINLHIIFFHALLNCPFDNQQFSRSLGYFVEHLKWKHPREFKDVEVLFKCPFCEINFHSLSDMKSHCKTCKEKRFSCTHCDKKFFKERQLKHHIALVNSAKSHKCSYCEKSFNNKTELNVHVRVHTDDKPYQCTFPGCNKAFRTNSHRSSHMDTHSSCENYQCRICPQRFKTRGARGVHEKNHSNPEASVCTICSKKFRQRSHLIRHVKVVHHIDCTSKDLEEKIATQINQVESSTVDENSNQ